MIHPSAKIHPTAIVADGAVIGEDVVIGPFCIIAVSYTHLKVVENSPAEKAGLLIGDKILAENSTALDWKAFVALVQQGPVSYTHLDVYKRQTLCWIF